MGKLELCFAAAELLRQRYDAFGELVGAVKSRPSCTMSCSMKWEFFVEREGGS